MMRAVWLLILAFWISPAHAGMTMTPDIGMGGCVNGYYRLQPHFCRATARVLIFTFNGTVDSVVRNQAIGGMTLVPNNPPPSSAKALLLFLDGRIDSKGVANTTHELNMISYYDHAGTQQITDIAFAAFEYTVTAGIWIGGGAFEILYPVTGSNLEITSNFVDTAGSGFGSLVQGAYILGYYD